MTLEQVKKIKTYDMNRLVAEAAGWTDFVQTSCLIGVPPTGTDGRLLRKLSVYGQYPGGRWSVWGFQFDLNAAMRLVPQHVGTRESAKQLGEFYEEFLYATGIGGGDNLYDMFKDFGGDRSVELPRALCEAFLLWKGSAT